MPQYNGQLEDPEAMERAHGQLRNAYRQVPFELEGMDEFLGRLDDLVWDDPDLGTSMTLQHARTQTDRYLEQLMDIDGDVSDLETALDRVNARAAREVGRYPAFGTDRHYSLDARRKNL